MENYLSDVFETISPEENLQDMQELLDGVKADPENQAIVVMVRKKGEEGTHIRVYASFNDMSLMGDALKMAMLDTLKGMSNE